MCYSVHTQYMVYKCVYYCIVCIHCVYYCDTYLRRASLQFVPQQLAHLQDPVGHTLALHIPVGGFN
jgi:hypothetical protein